MHISFAKNGNWKKLLTTAYTFRCSETPEFTQQDDCIISGVNAEHHEDFDNISLLSKEKYSVGLSATLHCSFEDKGCAEIILVPETETCPDGAVRYGACFEFLIWKNGINVWRHFRDDGRCYWFLRMSAKIPTAQDTVHELNVKVFDQYVRIALDDQVTVLQTEDLPEKFHVGITSCEGVVRLYDFKIEEHPSSIAMNILAGTERD